MSEADGVLMLRQGLKMVSFCNDCAEEVILGEVHERKLNFYDATDSQGGGYSQQLL